MDGQIETYANDWGGRTRPVICPPTEPVDMNNGISMDVAASELSHRPPVTGSLAIHNSVTSRYSSVAVGSHGRCISTFNLGPVDVIPPVL